MFSRIAVISLVIFFAMTPWFDGTRSVRSNHQVMASNELSPPLKRLMVASSFDDGVSGESGPSQNHATYAELSSQIQGVDTADLEYLLTHATPAGKLYAAVLLKQSSRVGNDQSFGKLIHDDSKVIYHSGCKGAEYKVSEIAAAFIKDGFFHNFRFSMFCKLMAPVETPSSAGSAADREIANSVALLLSAGAVERFQQGDSNQPAPVWRAFQVLRAQGNKAHPQASKLFASSNPASRVYGAILLLHIDSRNTTIVLQSLTQDTAPVVFSKGCAKEQTTVGELFKRLLNGEHIVMMKDPG